LDVGMVSVSIDQLLSSCGQAFDQMGTDV